MSDELRDLRRIIDNFVDGSLSVEQFQAEYLRRMKSQARFSEACFEILDKLFGDVDAYTSDVSLIRQNPAFFIDETELRVRAKIAAADLARLNQ